jgi:hypothetical protein
MSKRFTDTKKWRNEWFRTLPQKAKIVWSYLCDECEYYGVWKADYGLASFQVDFNFSETDLKSWFGDKVFFFDEDKVLIVPFFEFQYGDSKETWSVKVNARKKLETLGFTVVKNQVQTPTVEDSGVTVPDSTPDVLYKDKVKGKVKVNKGGVGENFISRIQDIYENSYPRKEGKTKGFEALLKDLKTDKDLEDFALAVSNYRDRCIGREKKFIKLFSTFAHVWRDYLEVEAEVLLFQDTASLDEIFKGQA